MLARNLENSVSNNVFLLRKALGEDPRYIETVLKRGYRFVGEVRCLPDGVRGNQEVAKFPASRPAIVAAAAETLPFWRSRAVGGISALVLCTLLVAVGWY
jgi:DNA-binding winged helix-turn-helix (wHTH) protein